MPTYLYESNGSIVEVFMSNAERERCERADGTMDLPDGTVGTRRIDLEHRGFRDSPDAWHRARSTGAGVHPSQIADEVARAKQHGINVDFAPDGDFKPSSRANRREYLKLRGLHDMDGGYGD